MPLTDEQKAANRFEKLLNHARTKQIGTYLQKFVARDLQKAIRAEAGAYVGSVKCVIDGKIETVDSPRGEVVCVTCAKVMPWSAPGTHAGHFLGGRSAGIVLEEAGIHCQCYRCNEHDSGSSENYQIYMMEIYGAEVIEELHRRKNGWYLDEDGNRQSITTPTKEELVRKRITYLDRIKRAEDSINNGGSPVATATANKLVPKKKAKQEVTQFRPRQLTFVFDYAAAGLDETSQNKLETLAGDIEVTYGNQRFVAVSSYLEMGAKLAEAKKEFKGAKSDETWADWCTNRLETSRSNADKMIRVHTVLGKKSAEDLAGLPAASLYKLCREGTTAKTRTAVLKIAKNHSLTTKDVDELLGGDKEQEEVKKIASAPSNREELKAWCQAKVVKSLGKKLNGSPVKDELPDVLRELADELAAA